MRERTGGAPWVAYWSADAPNPFGPAHSDAPRREFFHLEEDVDGQPTRWDDPRVAELAKAGGWREAGR